MALEATHLRFALDVKDNYNITDLKKYLAGTIYPDSRYVSGIDRHLTHGADILKPKFASDDFRAGWQVHQIVDSVQNTTHSRLLPDLGIGVYTSWDQEKWVLASATKNIQDMYDTQQFELQEQLGLLDYVENPNGEDIEKVRRYNQFIQTMYRGKKCTTAQDCHVMWLGLGVAEDLAQQILQKTEELLADV